MRWHIRRRQSRRKSAIERILYALPELHLLRRLIAVIAHRPAALGDPLLHSGERPLNAALRRTEAQDSGAVDRVLFHVAHELESDRPWPRNANECEAPVAEDRLRLGVLALNGGIIDRVVRLTKVTAGANQRKEEPKVSVSYLLGVIRFMTYSRAIGSATSA